MTLEKIFFKFPPLLRVLEPGTFRLRVRRSNHWAIPAPATQASKKKEEKKRRKALRRLKKKKKKKKRERRKEREGVTKRTGDTLRSGYSYRPIQPQTGKQDPSSSILMSSRNGPRRPLSKFDQCDPGLRQSADGHLEPRPWNNIIFCL